jgi:radical SAM superfamily enzyme YgiQ (UPF0313 family)
MPTAPPGLKALLLYPQTPRSYWSLQFSCDLLGCKAHMPPLGLITVAALLPQDWQLRLVDENTRPVTEADWDWADLVLISSMYIQIVRTRELIRQAKARGKTVVVGGPVSAAMFRDCLLDDSADFFIRGEAENLMPPFLAALAQGHRGGVFESPHKPDLAISPIPRFDLLHLEDYTSLSIQTTRGCPFDCEFCDVVSVFGRRVRHKAPAQVLAELEAIYRLGWRGAVFICDDNFIGSKKYARELLALLLPWLEGRGQPFNFSTQASVNLGHDLELIDLMTAANFALVFIGIESPDAEVLRLTQKYHNLRHPLVDSINAITANGLTVIGSFILGLDHESPGVGERIAAFVEATHLPHVMLNLLVPPPNSRLWQRLGEEGRLYPDRYQDAFNWESVGSRLIFRPTRPEAEILSEYVSLWERLFDRSHFLTRAYRYFLAMRPTRAALARARGETLPLPPCPHPAPTLLEKLQKARLFLRLAWRQGICASARRQFWMQLVGILHRNPTRLIRYLSACAMAEDMFLLRDIVRQRLAPFLQDEQ